MDDHVPALNTDSEEEYDWEEVEVPEIQPTEIEITLQSAHKPDPEAGKKRQGISHAERLLRIDCHKIHTVALLANAWIRNKWLNDELLHARLLSLCPLKHQNAFAVIHKSRIPDPNQRGRTFENAIRDLTDWWSSSFQIIPEGHLRNRTFDEVMRILERYQVLAEDQPNDEMDLEALQDALEEDGEVIRSPKSLMKHLLMASGSRDTSAQLFTALCRALGIPARLVVSIQSVPWQTHVGKRKPKYEKKTKEKGKGKEIEKVSSTENTSQASVYDESSEGNDMEEVQVTTNTSSKRNAKGKSRDTSFPGTGHRLDGKTTEEKDKNVVARVKLRKPRPVRQTLGGSPISHKIDYRADPLTTPPVFWTEVFSKADGRWLPVDPIRSIVNKRKVFDPTPAPTSAPPNAALAQFSRSNFTTSSKRTSRTLHEENRLLYVLAFEEDGYGREVTRRYAREFGAKVAKAQGGSNASNTGKARLAWWNRVLSIIQRPYRLHRDDVEDEELDTAQMLEGMPATMAGFKDHPIYVLMRHLKQNETIYPPPPATHEVGKFRGESVYPRSAVASLKTAENWMRSEGRTIKSGEQPLKTVKARAGTVNKMRELEVLREAGTHSSGSSSEITQGLYARHQTEFYVPDPVTDGVVPKNNFGNIDLYVPSMLPHGAVHIPFKGVAKIARKLGFDFAEAVTGFEFKKRRAFPVIEGIVIAKENEETVLEAYWEAEQSAEEKARLKREERVIKQWTRLIQGLRIRQRLQEQYRPKDGRSNDDRKIADEMGTRSAEGAEQAKPEQGGGFLVAADDVVEAFHLPKFQHVLDESTLSEPRHRQVNEIPQEIEDEEPATSQAPVFATYDLDTVDGDSGIDGEFPVGDPQDLVPKTMQQLAEDAVIRRTRSEQVGAESDRGAGQANVSDVDLERMSMKLSLSTEDNTSRETPVMKTSRPTRHRQSTSARQRVKRKGGINNSDSDNIDETDKESKRRRTQPTAEIATRTLRPRRSKTAAQIEKERQLEAAYRAATSR